MAQRILEPGEIESLAQRSIPRIRLPAPATLFVRRATRLRSLAPSTGISAYLQFLAALVDVQHMALSQLKLAGPSEAHLKRAAEHGMPPIPVAEWSSDRQWSETLSMLCATLEARAQLPAPIAQVIARIRGASSHWIAAQVAALLQSVNEGVDAAAAPLLMAAMQVHGVALAAGFDAAAVRPLDVPGVCPLCGSEPVASRVCANSPYQGYRYLHCALCATEWHMVRVQCSLCGASGKDIAYQSASVNSNDTPHLAAESAVRAETYDLPRLSQDILRREGHRGGATGRRSGQLEPRLAARCERLSSRH